MITRTIQEMTHVIRDNKTGRFYLGAGAWGFGIDAFATTPRGAQDLAALLEASDPERFADLEIVEAVI